MQVVSLSAFRFATPTARAWAFGQMGLARRPLARIPGIGFHKQFGTGTREGFYPVPNLSVYAILACWPGLDAARSALAEASVFRRYRDHGSESCTIFMTPVRSRGAWDGGAPFAVPAGAPEQPRPLAVLTRAAVRLRYVRSFWREAPDIDRVTADEPGLLFKLGMGEAPWLRQVTFSIWTDAEPMQAFAYRSRWHRDAARKAFDRGWFSEDLFARFAVLDAEGLWNGTPPLARMEAATAA